MATALDKYVRLEAEAEWRGAPEAAWQPVYVSFGKASLVIADFDDRPLAHWSLAATDECARDGARVVFSADPAMAEALAVSDPAMIEAIAAVTADARGLPQRPPRRPPLGRIALGLALVALIVLAAVRGPDALRRLAVASLATERAELMDADILAHLPQAPCDRPDAAAALDRLAAALPAPPRVAVAPLPGHGVARLPGGRVLIDPERLTAPSASQSAVLGWIALGQALGPGGSPLAVHMDEAPLNRSMRLLRTGQLSPAAGRRMAAIVASQQPEIGAATVARAVQALEQAGISPVPFLADLTSVHPGIAASPSGAGQVRPVIGDHDWVTLQGICDFSD